MDMKSINEKDSEYYDYFHEVSNSEKRAVVANVKTYEKTGTYVTIILFKRRNDCDNFNLNQKLTLSILEPEQLTVHYNKILQQLQSTNSENSEAAAEKKGRKRRFSTEKLEGRIFLRKQDDASLSLEK